jgi:glutaredoxin-related protein
MARISLRVPAVVWRKRIEENDDGTVSVTEFMAGTVVGHLVTPSVGKQYLMHAQLGALDVVYFTFGDFKFQTDDILEINYKRYQIVKIENYPTLTKLYLRGEASGAEG